MRTLILALCLTVFGTTAEARQHKHITQTSNSCYRSDDVMRPCTTSTNPFSGARYIEVKMKRVNSRNERRSRVVSESVPSFPTWVEQPVIRAAHAVERVVHTAGEIIGGRPSGCPYQYCGCSASLRVFGKIIPELNLAANWGRFPPASPAPGMAAYRAHHVFIIESVNSDGTVVAHDGNSGRHLTRIHTVSLRGYRVVNPHG